MSAIKEQCSVCSRAFAVTFRYQMEERQGAFVFFCSQECLGRSHGTVETAADGRVGSTERPAEGAVVCDACFTRFPLTLAAQVLYIDDRRRYACAMPCRLQLLREAEGARLGDLDVEPPATLPVPEERERISEVRAVPPAQPPQPAARNAQSLAGMPRKAPRRIAVFNHKGGTGKTTTSVSLAAGLAAHGYRVLLVDTDSQGNVAVSLGASCERTLYHVLVMGLRVADAVQSLRPGLDLLPSNETLAAAELYLAGRQNRDRLLSQRMGTGTDGYDYVVIDCSPSLSLMNQNALTFADSVLIPVACDYLSLVGVRQVIKTVKNVNTLLRHRLQIWGVLPTFFDARARICTEALATLQGHFGERCLKPIRATTKLKEAPAQARSIFEHAPGTHGAEDYEALVDAVLAAGSQDDLSTATGA